MKPFFEVLQDCFKHVTEVSDPEALKKFREDGILVDQEGYWTYSPPENKDIELCIEPMGEEGQYAVSIYKNRVLLIQRLPIWAKKEQT